MDLDRLVIDKTNYGILYWTVNGWSTELHSINAKRSEGWAILSIMKYRERDRKTQTAKERQRHTRPRTLTHRRTAQRHRGRQTETDRQSKCN